MIEREAGTGALALQLAAKVQGIEVMCMEEMMSEMQRQNLCSSIPGDAAALEATCSSVVASVCWRIVSSCAIENVPVLLVCEGPFAAHGQIAMPLMQVLQVTSRVKISM